jgi:iron complex transport system substrate-binding protein
MQKALSIYKIKTEVLEKLQPTHIITQDQCDVCAINLPEVERAIAQITNSHPQVISLQPDLLNEVWDDIERVANTLGVDFLPALDKLQIRLKAIANQVKDKSKKPTVVAIEWTEPLMDRMMISSP